MTLSSSKVHESFHIYDSVTKISPAMRDEVIIAASHGGFYAAYLAAAVGVKGIILSDAGIGRDRAGVAGLSLLEECHIAGAAVSYRSARIGDGRDLAHRGVISVANDTAIGLGVIVGMKASEAARLMTFSKENVTAPVGLAHESRTNFTPHDASRPVVLIDSASLVEEADQNALVITGSHGGLLGGDPASAIKFPVFAALYNDAGIGIDDAGVSRLPALDQQGIAAATIAAESACIGSARSTLDSGVLSRVNTCAAKYGAREGMTTQDWIALLCKC